MREILARMVLRDNHLRKPHDKQICVSKSGVEFGEKFESSRSKIKLHFILLGRRQRHISSYV